MKSNKFWVTPLTTVVSLLLLSTSLQAAELTPNVKSTPQKTPPEASATKPEVGGLAVPPAVPLDKLSNSQPAPSVGTKGKQAVKTAGASNDQAQPAEQPEAGDLPAAERPAAMAAKTPEETLAETPADDGLPTGKAVSTVSQPLRPADKKTVAEAEKKREDEGIYFNVAGEDIRELIKQISRVTGKNFILDDKIRGEVTIMSEKKMTKDEVYEAFLSALEVAGYTTVVGPVGLIKIVKKRDALTQPIPMYTEKTPYTDKFITRLLTLKNISAIDMANAIKGLISKEGNLFAYPATNTLIITDTGTNIDRIVRMVQELDTEGPQEVLEIIHIEYADVKDMADKISKLFGGAKTTTRTTSRRRSKKATTPSADTTPAINKVISDERTNSLIILASKITIAKVKDIIRRLDKPLIGPEEGDIHVLYLKNAKATEIAEVLTGVTSAAKKSQEKTKAAAKSRVKTPSIPESQFTGLFGSIKSIKADEKTNALIIQANAKDFRLLVDRIIAKLDIPRRQVYIEATIMELGVRKGRELGTGALGGVTFDAGGNEIALFGNTFPFIPGITSTSSVGGATTQDPISITPPFADNPINFPKLFAAFVAQANDTELNILSTPNILTLDNAEARIKVGDTIPFLTGNALTTGGVQTQNISREDVALELTVKPQITEGNNVRMTIKQKIEDFSDAVNPLEATAGPATSVREVESEVVVPDQHTIVLGGLMQDREQSSKTKIPLLGDIPVLGYLFKATSLSKRKVNLLVFLTPNIVREPQDFLRVMRHKIEQRNAFIDRNFGEKHRGKIRDIMAQHNERIVEFQAATAETNTPGYLPTDPLLDTPDQAFEAGDAAPPPPEETMANQGELSAAAPPPDASTPAAGSPRIATEPTPQYQPAPASPAPPPTAGDSGTGLPSDIDLAF